MLFILSISSGALKHWSKMMTITKCSTLLNFLSFRNNYSMSKHKNGSPTFTHLPQMIFPAKVDGIKRNLTWMSYIRTSMSKDISEALCLKRIKIPWTFHISAHQNSVTVLSDKHSVEIKDRRHTLCIRKCNTEWEVFIDEIRIALVW